MGNLMKLMIRLHVALLAFVTRPRRRDDRGDVPGWVLVTVMFASKATTCSV